MPRTCTICSRADRADIDQQIAKHIPFRTIAAQRCVSDAALKRHQKHISTAIAKVEARREVSVVDRLVSLMGKALDVVEAALADENRSIAIAGVREMRGFMSLYQEAAIEREKVVGAQSAKPGEPLFYTWLRENPKLGEQYRSWLRTREPTQ